MTAAKPSRPSQWAKRPAPISWMSTPWPMGAGGSISPSPENMTLVLPSSSPSSIDAESLFHLSRSEGAMSPLTEFPASQKVTSPSPAEGAVQAMSHDLSSVFEPALV